MAVALLSSHSSTALSDWRRAMISLLLKPWSSASQAGPRPMHISFRPLHVLCSFSQGSPDNMHESRRIYASQDLALCHAQADDDCVKILGILYFTMAAAQQANGPGSIRVRDVGTQIQKLEIALWKLQITLSSEFGR